MRWRVLAGTITTSPVVISQGSPYLDSVATGQDHVAFSSILQGMPLRSLPLFNSCLSYRDVFVICGIRCFDNVAAFLGIILIVGIVFLNHSRLFYCSAALRSVISSLSFAVTSKVTLQEKPDAAILSDRSMRSQSPSV